MLKKCGWVFTGRSSFLSELFRFSGNLVIFWQAVIKMVIWYAS